MEGVPKEEPAQVGRTEEGSMEQCEAELSRFGQFEAANDLSMSLLARTIEHQLIPRLMLAHRSAQHGTAGQPADRRSIGAGDVVAFAGTVLSADEDLSLQTIDSLRCRGVAVATIHLDLLAPTARYLGRLWEDDRCSFADVTVGLGRLQRILRELGSALGGAQGSVQAPPPRRVLLLPAPGEQHTFGLVMVADFFRQAGWDVAGGGWAAGGDAVALVSADWVDVIGFSVGAEIHLDRLTETIRAVRRASCNVDITILAGGPLFCDHPDYLTRIGADGVTTDGSQAPTLAESLMNEKAGRRKTSG